MGIFDKFLNAVRLNDDYDEDDEDFFDEDDEDFEDDEPSVEAAPKKSSRFTSRFGRRDEKTAANTRESEPSSSPAQTYRQVNPVRNSSKIKALKRKNHPAPTVMEVCVIKPTKIEDYKEIADTLLSGCTVILNLEGLDVELAQRIIDFSSGSCYAIDGNFKKVSSYIFTLTPSGVEITGDIQDLLNGTVQGTTMRNSF